MRKGKPKKLKTLSRILHQLIDLVPKEPRLPGSEARLLHCPSMTIHIRKFHGKSHRIELL